MAEKAFDRRKPYSTVHGMPGAVYEQNGVLYNRFEEVFVPPRQRMEPPQPQTPPEKPRYKK